MIKQIISGITAFIYSESYSSNVYLINGFKEKALIDSGTYSNANQLILDLNSLGIKPEEISLIFHTHGHADHFGADSFFKTAKIFMSKKDGEKVNANLNEFSFSEVFANNLNPKTDFIDLNKLIDLNPFKLKSISCPGHTSGGLSFFDEKNKILFSGDTIFNGNVGRYDLMTSNETELIDSIQKLSKLNIEFLLPGHGNIIKGRKKIKENFELIKNFL
jgi:hydroxyacylglutathione hydrolase